MKKNKKLLKNLKKSLDIVESEMKLDENGESIDSGIDGGSSLILECEIGCEELSNLKAEIDSISSILGNSGNCFVSPQGFSICPETIYDKLNNLSSDKIGENDGLAGTETLFQLSNLITESLRSPINSFGEETVLGKIENITDKILGDCGTSTICQVLQENTEDLDLTKSCLNTIKTNINSLQNSVNGTQASINGVQLTVNTLPTLTSIENSTILAKQATLNSVGSAVNGVQGTVNTLPTLTSIENSTILAKQATLNSIKSETDLIGLATDNSSSQTLFGKIANLKPTDTCFIKVMSRIAGAMIPMKDSGNNTFYQFIDPFNNNLITQYDSLASSTANNLAMQNAFNYINNSANWPANFCS